MDCGIRNTECGKAFVAKAGIFKLYAFEVPCKHGYFWRINTEATKTIANCGYELKYFYWEAFTGLVKMCLDSGCSLNQDTINGIKDAIIDDMYCGMEPEFEEYGMWQWWESLSYEWFVIKEQKHFDGKLVSYVECMKKPKDFIEGQND